MSYGQNAPWGLQAIRTQVDASWNGKTSTYLIASGYAQNIFKGDLVYINAAGYIQNYNNVTQTAGNTKTPALTLGVFMGCSYAVSVANNPIDPFNPGHAYWPSGTATFGNVPAIASIITDPQVVFNAQVTGNAGATQADVGNFVQIAYQTSGGQVQGNFNTGQSFMSVILPSSRAVPTASPVLPYVCWIDALSSNPNNVSGQQYNNVEVMLSSHYFRVIPSLMPTA